MAQTAKIVDITKSYIPIDPQAFAENLSHTAREDDPEKGMPIIPFEAWNILPTSYGYRSYFGVQTELTLNALAKPCDKIFIFQSKQYENMVVALCSDGIYTARVGSSAWTHAITLTDDWTISGIYKEYTFCTIENNLYVYRQGYSKVIKISDALVITEFTPTFLNMAGQMGIFRANGRLAFWDSEDSISWSDPYDFAEFTPNIETYVGNLTFYSVLGRIVTILPHGEGYVIYATKSIVGVSYNASNVNLWDAMPITGMSGIAHPRAVCIGQNNTEHYAYTSTGISKIGHFNALSRQYDAALILPELYDFLKESREPIYLDCHAARYLHFSIINPDYIGGRTVFTDVDVPSLIAPPITIDQAYIDSIANSGFQPSGDEIFQTIDSFLRDPYATINPDYTAATYQIPRWIAYYTEMGLKNIARDSRIIPSNVSDYHFSLAYPEYAFRNPSDIAGLATRINNTSFVGNAQQERTFEFLRGVYNTESRSYDDYSQINRLYPNSDTPLHPGNTHGLNAWDVIYNVMAVFKQNSDVFETNYQAALAKPTHYENTYTFVSGTMDTIDNSMTDWEPLLIPRKAPAVRISMDNYDSLNTLDGGTRMAKLSIEYHDSEVVEVVPSVTRTLTTRTTLPSQPTRTNIKELPADGEYFVILTQSRGSVKWIKTFATEPTIASINAALVSNPFYIFGEPCHLETDYKIDAGYYQADQNEKIMFSHHTAILNNFPEVRALVVMRVYRASVFDDDLYEAVYQGLTSETYGDLVAIGNATRDTTNSPYYYCVADPAWNTDLWFCSTSLILHSLKARLHRYQADGLYLPTLSMCYNKIGDLITIDIDSLQVYTVAGTYHNREIRGNGINQNTGETITDKVFYVFNLANFEYLGAPNFLNTDTYPVNYIHTFQEVVDITFAPAAYSVVDPDEFYVPHQRSLVFTLEAIDTYTKQSDGSYLKTAEVNKATHNPIFNDYTFQWDPVNNPSYYNYNLPKAYAVLPFTTSCLRWTIQHFSSAGASDTITGTDITDHSAGTLHKIPMPLGPIDVNEVEPCYDTGANSFSLSIPSDFTYPGTTYTLQDGTPVAGYPTFAGSIVFDMDLKKWGKNANPFKTLFEFSPLNATDDAVIPYTNFGADSGILKASGKMALFSQQGAASHIRYGKFGLYRLGFTEVLEVILHFRTKSTGEATIDGSIDARSLYPAIQHVEAFTNTLSHTVKCHVNARWHTISLSGNFDLQYLEVRGIMAGRR